MLTFTVFGVAQSKGSMRAFTPRGMKFPIVTDSNRKAKAWAQLVAEGASRALGQQLAPKMLTTPIRVTIAFYLPRPKRFAKRGARPIAHLTAPDIDKLLRSVLDALTEVLYLDDAQVVEVLAMKRYADVDVAPHVTIRVEETYGTQALAVPPAPLPLFEETRV
jgi:Holliday junction resolvase RusA-like endonuclease